MYGFVYELLCGYQVERVLERERDEIVISDWKISGFGVEKGER